MMQRVARVRLRRLSLAVVCLRAAGWCCGSRFTRRRWFATARKRRWSPRTHTLSRTTTDPTNCATRSAKSLTGSWRSAETAAAPVKRSDSRRLRDVLLTSSPAAMWWLIDSGCGSRCGGQGDLRGGSLIQRLIAVFHNVCKILLKIHFETTLTK